MDAAEQKEILSPYLVCMQPGRFYFSNIEKGIDPSLSHIHLMPTIHKIFLVAKATLELAVHGQLLNQSLYLSPITGTFLF